MSAAPAVSVVIPAYNAERHVAEAIESVLSQTLADLELIVVDDGSTDRTSEIFADYARRDARVVVLDQPNQGSATALNRGIGQARAPLIARLDADDVAMPDRLERQLAHLAADDQLVLLGGGAAFIDERGREFATAGYPLTDAAIRERFATSTPFVHSAVVFRRAAWETAGGYRAPFEPAEDIDIYLRLGEHGKLANLDELVVKYRVHAGQVSAEKIEQQAIHSLAARASARFRAGGEADPFDGVAVIDEALLRTHGTSLEQIDYAVVGSTIWLAKTMDRAGHDDEAARLFSIAADRAASSRDAAALRARVHRARAERRAEEGRPARARLESLRAGLLERRARRRA